jgi:hypothetical protein
MSCRFLDFVSAETNPLGLKALKDTRADLGEAAAKMSLPIGWFEAKTESGEVTKEKSVR